MRIVGFANVLLMGICLSLLSGCSVFETYPTQMQAVRADLVSDQPKTGIKDLPAPASYNKDLYNLELGRLQQLSGQYQDSLNTYNSVIADVEAKQLQAKYRVSSMLQNTGAVMVNDNLIPYLVPGYAIVMLYQYQALNYLALGNQQDALVMMRKAQLAQQLLSQQYYQQIVDAQQASAQQAYQLRKNNYPTQYSAMMAAASQIKSSFMNPMSDYFASLLYRASGDLNNAIVSLKNALQSAPDNPYLRSALLIDMQQQGGDNQLPQYLRAFGVSAAPSVPSNAGTLAVIYEQSLIPAMQEVQVPVPVLSGGALMVAFPFYASSEQPAITPLSFSLNGTDLGQTALLTNNFLLAEKALTEEYPFIVLRLALQIAVQYGAIETGNHKQNAAVSLGVMLYSFLTAHADLRSWLTLPANVQIFQGIQSAGAYTLNLSGTKQQSIPVTITAGRITLLWVTDLGTRLQVNLYNL